MFEWFKRKIGTPPAQPVGPTRDQSPIPPPPPGVLTRDVHDQGCVVRLDLTRQVLGLDMPKTEMADEGGEERLAATCPAKRGFVSASMLAIKAKLFDDGLYAAAEIAAQPAKANLLRVLADRAPLIAAAAALGGVDVRQSAEAKQLVDEFLADESASKPLGFYTWNDPLRRIFHQDRMLQRELPREAAAALTAALAADETLRTAYGKHLDFVARLTNPLVGDKPDLRAANGTWFFPPSRAHETDLVKRLYGNRPIPDGFSLADEMVKGLLAGTLSLEPRADSGWYDLQTWALEPLVLIANMPESARLETNKEYRTQLIELFKAILSLSRETHVKQLEFPTVGCAMLDRSQVIVDVAPELSVEPLITHYRRRARGYEFVRDVCESAGFPLARMQRVTPEGPAKRSLAEELEEIRSLFTGAADVAGHELGIAPATNDAAGRFRAWAKAPDVGGDVRMMVPVFHDEMRKKTKVWAVLGWSTRRLIVTFATPPAAEVLRGNARIRFTATTREVAYPVFAETYVSRLLDRDEFRAHCDRYRTRERILQSL